MKGHMQDGKFHPHTDYKKGVRKSRDRSTKSVGIKIERKTRYVRNWKGKSSEIYGYKDLDQARAENERIDKKNNLYKQNIISLKNKIQDFDELFKSRKNQLEKDLYEKEQQSMKYSNENREWYYLNPHGIGSEVELEIVDRIDAVAHYIDYDDASKSDSVYLVDGKWMTIGTYYRSDKDGSPTDEAYLKTREVELK